MKNILKNDIQGTIKTKNYLCEIQWRNGTLLMDEPLDMNGQDIGPDPYSTLLSSLAGCTLITLRMYIDRKKWNIPEIKVSLNLSQENTPELTTHITKNIQFSGAVTQEQKERLLLVAEKCPISKILKNNVMIHTSN